LGKLGKSLFIEMGHGGSGLGGKMVYRTRVSGNESDDKDFSLPFILL